MKTLTCSWCDTPNAEGATTCASCGAPLREEGARLVMESVVRALPPETVLRDGDYKILSILGQGGFGITYRALNSRLGREVAIKEYFPSSCDREGLLVSPSGGTTAKDYESGKSAFLSEARVLARFDHPAIVRVFGAWEENRSAYMEMELLRGQTLAQVLDQYRRLNPNDVLRLFNPILDALQVLHNEGYLHRDVKPQNLMLCGVAPGATDAESCVRHARAVLLDFGAAHHVGSGASQALSVVVTPGYAPLEQYAQRARRGAFTDIYALCATLYHTLSGQTPPPASDRAIGQALTPLEDLVSGLPKEWYSAIAAGLQTEIAKRPQTIGELRSLMGGHAPATPPPYQPNAGQSYSDTPKYGAVNPSASQPPPLAPSNPNSPAQSLIAQSLLNAVPDPNAPQVLAPAPPAYNAQHPLGNATGAPVALSQPSSAMPLVPPQASQTATHQSAQQQAHNHAQHNNAANDVRMRQVAALLYLGSPIVFAFLWWLFAVSSGPHMAPPTPFGAVPPPISRPYTDVPPAPMSSQEELPKMRFSLANTAISSLDEWSDKPSHITNSTLSSDGKWAAGIDSAGTVAVWDVKTGEKSWSPLRLTNYQTAHFSFAPDSSKLMIHLPRNAVLSMLDLATGKILWSNQGATDLPAWSSGSSKLIIAHDRSTPSGLLAASGKPFENYFDKDAERTLLSGGARFSPNGLWLVKQDSDSSLLVSSTKVAHDGMSMPSVDFAPGSYAHYGKGDFWFSADSRWFLCRTLRNSFSGQSSELKVFDMNNGKELSLLNITGYEDNASYGREIDFTLSPQGRYVAIRNGTHELRLWNVQTHEDKIWQWGNMWDNTYVASLVRKSNQLLGNRLVFSPDERKILMVDNDEILHEKIRLIDLSRQEISEMKSPFGTSDLRMQWTPDGKAIAWIDGTSGKMGRLKLSDFKTFVPVQVLAGGPPNSKRN